MKANIETYNQIPTDWIGLTYSKQSVILNQQKEKNMIKVKQNI